MQLHCFPQNWVQIIPRHWQIEIYKVRCRIYYWEYQHWHSWYCRFECPWIRFHRSSTIRLQSVNNWHPWTISSRWLIRPTACWLSLAAGSAFRIQICCALSLSWTPWINLGNWWVWQTRVVRMEYSSIADFCTQGVRLIPLATKSKCHHSKWHVIPPICPPCPYWHGHNTNFYAN